MDYHLHRRYVIRLAQILAVFTAITFAIGVYIGPFQGDLTRQGGYAERDFGWTQPQTAIRGTLSEYGSYNGYHDVVVLGDSFSTGRAPYQWQAVLSALTGWSILTLDAKKISVSTVLSDKHFQNTPPRLFIFERVERTLHRVFTQETEPCRFESDPTSHIPAPPLETPLQAETYSVSYGASWNEYLSHGFVFAYLTRAAKRHLPGNPWRPTVELHLTRTDLFSNRRPRSLLVTEEDLFGKPWGDVTVHRIQCGLLNLQKQVESNGITAFIALLVPDKLTAYAPYVHEVQFKDKSHLQRVFAKQLRAIDLLTPIAAALRANTTDLYRPNDTHWGSAGHRLAAHAIIDQLIGQNSSDQMHSQTSSSASPTSQ